MNINDLIARFLREFKQFADGGSTSTSDSSSAASPSTFALETGPAPLAFRTSLAAPPTMSLSVLEGATISGGSVGDYTDLGDDTGGALANITISPTIDTRGTTLFTLLQVNVLNLGDIILKPNTTYVFEITNTSITGENFLLSNIFRVL